MLRWTNFFLQLLFIRLTLVWNGDGRNYWYAIQGVVVPFTGWVSDFIYLTEPRFLRITPKIQNPKLID